MKQKILGKGFFKTFTDGIQREWVMTNGIGGYCGSSVIGAHTRKHHGLLIASLHPPVERYMVVSKLEETLTLDDHQYSLATNQKPGNYNEEGQRYLQEFIYDGTVQYVYVMEGIILKKSIAMEHGKNTVAISYEVSGASSAGELSIVPFINYREHGERSQKADLTFRNEVKDTTIHFFPQKNDHVVITCYTSEGTITERTEPYYEDMMLQTELDTGNTGIDTNYTPYEIHLPIKAGIKNQFSFIATIEDTFNHDAFAIIANEKERLRNLISTACFENEFANELVVAADQFIVDRLSTNGKTVLAGLPWFTDWGRDTMIAFTGLTLVTKRFDDAKSILKTFANYVSDGLIPNMFPDEGLDPLYNTVDASLWYIYAIDQYLRYSTDSDALRFVKEELYSKLEEIITAYKEGTKFSIYMDEDGLIHAGDGLDQVTWMDVRVGDWVVTPRHGKPVEINALWYNALCVMARLAKEFGYSDQEYLELAKKVKCSFNEKFWNEDLQCLFDVVDENDAAIRPNQIYAVSLPYTMLSKERAHAVVTCVRKYLYANHGLRSLAPNDAAYQGKYFGKLHDRDAAYHQGTCWAYPLGAFITAFLKVNEYSTDAKEEATQLLAPMRDTLLDGCIGSIAEIYDGDEPNLGRGCYAQAWSVGEILRCLVEGDLSL